MKDHLLNTTAIEPSLATKNPTPEPVIENGTGIPPNTPVPHEGQLSPAHDEQSVKAGYAPQPPPSVTFISRRDLAKRRTISLSTQKRLEQDPRHPRPVQISPGRVAFVDEECIAFDRMIIEERRVLAAVFA